MGYPAITQPENYLEIRRRIDPELRFIQKITGLLAKFEQSGEARLEVDPVVLGMLHAMLEQSAGNIRQALDEWLPGQAGDQIPSD